MATVKYDDSWLRKVSYGGPRIDWDVAWNYFEAQRQAARQAERLRTDPAARLLEPAVGVATSVSIRTNVYLGIYGPSDGHQGRKKDHDATDDDPSVTRDAYGGRGCAICASGSDCGAPDRRNRNTG